MNIREIPIVLLDTETEVKSNLPVEISACLVKGGQLVDCFSTLVDIMRPIGPESYNIHGITDEKIREHNAPLLPVALRCFHHWMQTQAPVAVASYNWPFDSRILKQAAQRWAEDLYLSFFGPAVQFDVMRMGNKLFEVSKDPAELAHPNFVYDRKLKTLYAKLGGLEEQKHRGLSDVHMVHLIFEKMLTLGIERGHFSDYSESPYHDFFTWINSSALPTRIEHKKHKGELITSVVETDPGYCDWILREPGMDPDLKKAIIAARKCKLSQKSKDVPPTPSPT